MYTISDESVRSTVVTAATEIAHDMKPGRQYRFTADTDCYVRVTSAGGAAASIGAGSTLCRAGQVLLVGVLGARTNDGVRKTRISVIRASADGACTLTEIVRLPNE